MNPPVKRIGVSATPATWSKALRSYARDHATGVEIETLLDPRQLTRADRGAFHVLVVDDVARVFGPAAVAAAQAGGTFVIGLYDEVSGLGRAHLDRLGVQLALPDSTGPAELLETIARLAPDSVAASSTVAGGTGLPAAPNRRGRLSVWSSASGGSGLSEALIGTAEGLARDSRVVVIESDPLSAVLAARLNRSPAFGLGWCLNRLAQGRPCLPGGLSGAGEESHPPLGRFDVVCQTAVSGRPAAVEPGLLTALVDEAMASYDHVLLAAGPLTAASGPAGRDRMSAGHAQLSRADVVIGWACADPIGAVALADWRVMAEDAGLAGQTWGVLGRSSRSRFEEQQLADLVGTATATHPFQRLTFLPEDEAVRRARWDGMLVGRGRWHDATLRMAAALSAVPTLRRTEPATGDSWGLVMAR